MIERWNTRVKSITHTWSLSLSSLLVLLFATPPSRFLSFSIASFFSFRLFRSSSFFLSFFFYRKHHDHCQPVAANEWRAAATLMNRLWAARHTDIMVPTADSWNCYARTSWQINRRRRQIDRARETEKKRERTELIFRTSQRLAGSLNSRATIPDPQIDIRVDAVR